MKKNIRINIKHINQVFPASITKMEMSDFLNIIEDKKQYLSPREGAQFMRIYKRIRNKRSGGAHEYYAKKYKHYVELIPFN